MAASPDLSRLPPRGPGDLGRLENTSQDRQLEKQLSFFETNRRMKHLNALLIMYTTYITSQSYITKITKKILLLLCW
jgi:hypothetical protein